MSLDRGRSAWYHQFHDFHGFNHFHQDSRETDEFVLSTSTPALLAGTSNFPLNFLERQFLDNVYLSKKLSRTTRQGQSRIHNARGAGIPMSQRLSALSLSPSSIRFRSSKMLAQLHLRERPRALFGQPNSPRHCFVPSFGWPASVDPRFGHDKMFAGEPPKPPHPAG